MFDFFAYIKPGTVLNLSPNIVKDDKFKIDLIPKEKIYDNIYLGKVENYETNLRDLINKSTKILGNYGMIIFEIDYGNGAGKMDRSKLIKFVNYETRLAISFCNKVDDDLYVILKKEMM
jgi:hypothetical protein